MKDKILRELIVPVDAEVLAMGEYSSTLNGLTHGRKGRLIVISGDMLQARQDLYDDGWMRLIFGFVILLILTGVFWFMHFLHMASTT